MININWAKTVFLKHCGGRSMVAMRKAVKEGQDLTLSLVGTSVTVSYDDGAYWVEGGPRGKTYCGWTFECARDTMCAELARTVPA